MGVSGQRHAPAARFTPGERTPGTHWTGGWVGPRASLDAETRRKILCPCRGSNLDRPARSQTLYRLSYRGSQFLGMQDLNNTRPWITLPTLLFTAKYESWHTKTTAVNNSMMQFLQKLTVAWVIKKMPTFYETTKCIAVLTTSSHWSLSWARRIQSTSWHHISILTVSFHLLSSDHFPSEFKTLYDFENNCPRAVKQR
jgi:hypothetical protein